MILDEPTNDVDPLRHHVRVGHNLVAAIDETDAAGGISWATGLVADGARQT